MAVGQFEKPSPNKLISAMQKLANRTPVTAVNRLTPSNLQSYTGTFVAAEAADANLSQVILQGGALVRFVPKVAGLTLAANDVVKLERSGAQMLHITGKLVGNHTLASAPTNVTPPGAPTSYHTTAVNDVSTSVAWTAGTDHFGSGLKYNIFLNGSFRQTTAVGATSATITGLKSNTNYSSYVVASDGAGNASKPSSTIAWTTATTSVPSGSTVTKSYKATKMFGYNYNGHNERDTWHDGNAYQGNPQDGRSYNQFGLIFFDWVQIADDLAGNDITACSLSITYAHFYFNSGGKAIIGTHDYQSVPMTQSDSHADKDLFRVNAKAGQKLTINMGVTQGNNFKSGHAKGIQTGPQPSDIPGGTCYGYTYGTGSKGPVLTFTFTTN